MGTTKLLLGARKPVRVQELQGGLAFAPSCSACSSNLCPGEGDLCSCGAGRIGVTECILNAEQSDITGHQCAPAWVCPNLTLREPLLATLP